MEPGDTLDRVRSAIAGQLNPATLTEQERVYYYELLDDELATPSADEIEAAAARGREPGAVGYDDSGRLVRSLAEGGTEVIEEEK